MRAEFTINSGC